MTGDVAESLAEMLKGQPHLRALNLNDTSLEDAGVSTIAQALANSGMPLPILAYHLATTCLQRRSYIRSCFGANSVDSLL
jgi:Ran GTPase-activating protein (RanGAP) involved in mRNA processing and transport